MTRPSCGCRMKGHHGSVRYPTSRCGWPVGDGEDRCDWCRLGHPDDGRYGTGT